MASMPTPKPHGEAQSVEVHPATLAAGSDLGHNQALRIQCLVQQDHSFPRVEPSGLGHAGSSQAPLRRKLPANSTDLATHGCPLCSCQPSEP